MAGAGQPATSMKALNENEVFTTKFQSALQNSFENDYLDSQPATNKLEQIHAGCIKKTIDYR